MNKKGFTVLVLTGLLIFGTYYSFTVGKYGLAAVLGLVLIAWSIHFSAGEVIKAIREMR